MAWRPQTPHEHTASNGDPSARYPYLKVTAKPLRPLALLLLLAALLALLLPGIGEHEADNRLQSTHPTPAIVTIEDINASIKAGQLTVTFDAVMTQAVANSETIGYRVEAGDGNLPAPLLAEGTVTFSPGELRKSVQLSFQTTALAAWSIVLHSQSPAVSIGGDGRYRIMLADAAPPARKKLQRKKSTPETVLTAESPRAVSSDSPETETSGSLPTPSSSPVEEPSIPGDADESRLAIRPPSESMVDERNAGLNFLKLDANGKPLADQSADYATTPWSCVLDLATALVWEIKSDDGGLHDKDWTYTWYDTRAGNGGNAGTAGKGFCGDTLATGCDTEKFAAAVNSAGLCGANDWRLPTQQELQSIAALDRVAPSIDAALFPNTQPSWYWTSSPVVSDVQHAWIIGFYYGYDVWGHKSHDFYARLVRKSTTHSPKLTRRSDK